MNTPNTRLTITRIFKAFLAGLCLLGFGMNQVIARELIALDYSAMDGNTAQLVFTFDDDAIEPRAFVTDQPARIALDFADTVNALEQRSMEVNIGKLQSIMSAGAKSRTRVVLNLIEKSDYTTSLNGNKLTLTMPGSEQLAPPAPQAKVNAPTTRVSLTDPPSGMLEGIKDIDFKRGPNGEGRIILDLTSNSISTDVWRENNILHVKLIGSQLPNRLQRRLDVVDFATPVTTIDTTQDGANIKMTIAATSDFEHLTYQAEKIYTIEVAPIARKKEKKKTEFGYIGERLSLNFQDIEVRSVLQLLSDFTGLNLVVSDSVEGNITLRLNNVPWDQAMDIILKTKGLAQRRAGNVILIAPSAEITTREKLELEALRQSEDLEPLRTEFIRVNYAKAEEMAALLKQTDNAILSDRGSVSVGARTNTLLIKDTNSSLANVRELLAELDIPVRQVLIESRVVIAFDDFSKELGVRFGVSRDSAVLDPFSSDSAVTAGNLNGVANLVNNDEFTVDDGLNVNLPVGVPAGSFALALAKLPLGTLLELELSAAQNEGRGEIVSSPRVITANSHTAKIAQGVEIPYLALKDGTATLTFREAELSLEVTPQITPDNRVIMDINVHKDSQGADVNYGNGAIAPTIVTNEVQSQLLVDNGQTVVLGGIYETESATQVTRVPFFSDLPIVGALFRSRNNVNDRSELLIFVTPRILQGSIVNTP